MTANTNANTLSFNTYHFLLSKKQVAVIERNVQWGKITLSDEVLNALKFFSEKGWYNVLSNSEVSCVKGCVHFMVDYLFRRNQRGLDKAQEYADSLTELLAGRGVL